MPSSYQIALWKQQGLLVLIEIPVQNGSMTVWVGAELLMGACEDVK